MACLALLQCVPCTAARCQQCKPDGSCTVCQRGYVFNATALEVSPADKSRASARMVLLATQLCNSQPSSSVCRRATHMSPLQCQTCAESGGSQCLTCSASTGACMRCRDWKGTLNPGERCSRVATNPALKTCWLLAACNRASYQALHLCTCSHQEM